jgi:hypothetical protein
MSDTKSYSNNWDKEKKIKGTTKGKRFVDKYRKAIYNGDSEAFEEYLEHEAVRNKTKLR